MRTEIAIPKRNGITAFSEAAGRGMASPRFPAAEERKAKLPKIKRFRTPSLLSGQMDVAGAALEKADLKGWN